MGDQGDVFWRGLNFYNLIDLEQLYMKKIPPLPLDDFRMLTSLKKIVIQGASSFLPPVEGESHGMYRFPVEELNICECETSGKELTLLLSFFPNLSKLDIHSCENITGLGVAETVSEEEQEQETRVGEEEIISAAAAEGLLLLPPHLQELEIFCCKNVSILPNPSHGDHAGEGRGGGLQRLRSLHILKVQGCPEFLSSYSSSTSPFFPFPACLQHLSLMAVKHMETLQVLSNLTCVTNLGLGIVGNSRDEGLWPLLTTGCLTKLVLHTDSDFFTGSDPSRWQDKEVFSRSCKLFHLRTTHKTGVLSAPICNLLSSTLNKLDLCFDLEVECLTKEQEEALQLLTSLQELDFCLGAKLQRLPAGLHKLINLKKLLIFCCGAIRLLPSLPNSVQELWIKDCLAIKSLPNNLPISLEILMLYNCKAIKSLPNSLPSSLEKLEISDCNAIKSLPKAGLPSSMLELNVYYGTSEELKRACRKFIGTIPIVRA